MPHTNFSIKFIEALISPQERCVSPVLMRRRHVLLLLYLLQCHIVPKRLQLFFALRAITLIPCESVLMYRRTRAFPYVPMFSFFPSFLGIGKGEGAGGYLVPTTTGSYSPRPCYLSFFTGHNGGDLLNWQTCRGHSVSPTFNLTDGCRRVARTVQCQDIHHTRRQECLL